MQDNIVPDNSVYLSKLIEGRLLNNGKEFEERLNNVDPDDIVTIIYTSEPPAIPGAVHTHRSFLAGIFPSLCYPEAGPHYVPFNPALVAYI